jgi:hypothetical protein
VKQIYPLVAFAVLLAAGFFFVSNFQVTTDQPGGPQLVPRDNPAANGGGPLPLPFGLGQQTTPTGPTPPVSSWLTPATPSAQQNLPVSVPGRQTLGGDVIRIASFNIQVFGEQKISNPDVVRILADVIRHFDIVAVQEIRDERQSLLPNFLQIVNGPGARYDYAIGPRLGRTTSKEQYAYIFNTDTIDTEERRARSSTPTSSTPIRSRSIAARCTRYLIPMICCIASRWSLRSAHGGPIRAWLSHSHWRRFTPIPHRPHSARS